MGNNRYYKMENSNNLEVHIIDCYELGYPGRTGIYVIPGDDGITLIDTCTSPSIRYIIAGLHEMKFELSQIKKYYPYTYTH